jgi:hypothetical protein
MGFKAPASGGSTEKTKFENPETGNYPARCIAVVDMGTKDNTWEGVTKKKREMILIFELNELMQDGRPFVSNWWNTLSLAPGSNLTAILESWRGKKFESDKEREAFDMSAVLDMPCQVSLVESKTGNISVGKHGVAPLMKGYELPARVNPLVDFGIDDIGTESWDNLYPWLQVQIIEKSDEGKAYLAANPGFEYGKKTSQADQPAPAVGTGADGKPPIEAPF